MGEIRKMSSVECRAGTITNIYVPRNLSFSEAARYIRTFIVDFPWDDIDDEVKYIHWESKSKAVMYLNDSWWLINYEYNNTDQYMSCFHRFEDGYFFAEVYYNGGTNIREILEQQLKINH
jgi:hypothetical protein